MYQTNKINNMFHNPRSILKKTSTETKKVGVSVSTKKANVKFDEVNVEATQRIPLPDRTYGFLKTDNEIARTPYPKKTFRLDSDLLYNRLDRLERRIDTEGTDSFADSVDSTDSPEIEVADSFMDIDTFTKNQGKYFQPSTGRSSSSGSGPLTDKQMRFIKQRKDFDYAEYTITLGIKMSDMLHPPIDVSHKTGSLGAESDEINLQTIKDYCHSMNISVVKH